MANCSNQSEPTPFEEPPIPSLARPHLSIETEQAELLQLTMHENSQLRDKLEKCELELETEEENFNKLVHQLRNELHEAHQQIRQFEQKLKLHTSEREGTKKDELARKSQNMTTRLKKEDHLKNENARLQNALTEKTRLKNRLQSLKEERDKLLEDNICLNSIVESLQTELATNHSIGGGCGPNLAVNATSAVSCTSCLELVNCLQEYKRLYGELTYNPNHDGSVSPEGNNAASDTREIGSTDICDVPPMFNLPSTAKCKPKLQVHEKNCSGKPSAEDSWRLSESWHPLLPGSCCTQTSKFDEEASLTDKPMHLQNQNRTIFARCSVSEKRVSMQRPKRVPRTTALISAPPRRKVNHYRTFRPQSVRSHRKIFIGKSSAGVLKQSIRFVGATSKVKSPTPQVTNGETINTLLPSPLALLQQRNNCLVQQLKVVQASKTASEEQLKHINTRLQYTLDALCKSRSQEQHSRRVMQHLIEYIIKLNKVVNLLDASLSNKTVEYFDEQVVCYSTLLENSSVKNVYDVSRMLALRVQSSLERKAQSMIVMRKKLADLTQQDVRRRALITELRQSLFEAKQEQSQVHSKLVEKENEAKNIRQTEARMRIELESQRIQLKTVMREKFELTQELKNCQEAYERIKARLNEVQRQMLDWRTTSGAQGTQGVPRSPKDPIDFSQGNKMTKVLSLFQNMMNQLSILAVSMLHELCKGQTHRAESNQIWITKSDSGRSVSPRNLEIARQRAAQILGLSLQQLDRLTGKTITEFCRDIPNFRTSEAARLLEKALNWPMECRRVLGMDRLHNASLGIFVQIMDDFQLIVELCTSSR